MNSNIETAVITRKPDQPGTQRESRKMPIISSPAYKTPTPGYQSSLPPPGVTSPLKTPYELVQAQSRILRYPWATYLAFEELISTFNS